MKKISDIVVTNTGLYLKKILCPPTWTKFSSCPTIMVLAQLSFISIWKPFYFVILVDTFLTVRHTDLYVSRAKRKMASCVCAAVWISVQSWGNCSHHPEGQSRTKMCKTYIYLSQKLIKWHYLMYISIQRTICHQINF